MITDYSILLFILTVVTGAVWLFELFYLAPRRAGTASPVGTGTGAAAVKRAGQPLWLEYTAGFFPVLALVFLVRSFLYEPYSIPSASMTPTLLVGDYILVNKFTYGIRLPILNRKIVEISHPKAGDVMVFRHPTDGVEDLIKRVVGVPGDRVDYHNKRLTINGHALTYEQQPDYLGDDSLILTKRYGENLNGVRHSVLETEGRPPLITAPDNFPGRDRCQYDDDGFSCTVPPGQYFMMGDNRDDSLDSRYWGFVPDQNIVGKAFVVWMNFHQLGHIGAIH
jgi:signal peptidase I